MNQLFGVEIINLFELITKKWTNFLFDNFFNSI
jgi:hypothetical protein